MEGGKQERLTILRAMLEAKLDREIILKAGFTEEEIENLQHKSNGEKQMRTED